MPSYHLHTANDAEQIYTGRHVELIVAQGESTETAHFITKQENTLFHTDIYSWPDSSLCHKVYQKHNQANFYVKLGSHKHCYNKQTTYNTVWLSSICSYPTLWAVLIHIIWTHYMAQCSEKVPPEFWITLIEMETGTGGNFLLSLAAPWHIRTAQVITQEQKLHDSCNVPSDQFNVQFCLQHGSPTRGHKPAGDPHRFIFFHVRHMNQQPTITGVDLSNKNVGCPWFTVTRVIRYQPFLLVHNAWFHF